MIQNFILWLRSRFMYVIADATDNSITFSRRLFNDLNVMNQSEAQIYTFFIPESNCYGFILNPDIEQETQLAEVKYNAKHKCIGYECLVPTVNRIFYDYGLNANTRCKLSVQSRKTKNGLKYYQINRPYGKYSRQ